MVIVKISEISVRAGTYSPTPYKNESVHQQNNDQKTMAWNNYKGERKNGLTSRTVEEVPA